MNRSIGRTWICCSASAAAGWLMAALCVGIVGALLGLFSAFMPPIVSYFVPWGYFEPLSAYEVAVWDQATHTVIYGTRPYNWALLLATIALGCCCSRWRGAGCGRRRFEPC